MGVGVGAMFWELVSSANSDDCAHITFAALTGMQHSQQNRKVARSGHGRKREARRGENTKSRAARFLKINDYGMHAYGLMRNHEMR